MDDPILQKAMKEREDAARRVAQLDSFIEIYRSLSASSPAVVDMDIESKWPETRRNVLRRTTTAASVLQRLQEVNATKRARIISAARECLEVTQPLQTDELLGLVKARGVTVGGANELVNLSSYLSKSDLFEHRRKDGGWFLAPVKEPSPRPDGGEPTGAEDLA